jgi:YYY domain-containing protein
LLVALCLGALGFLNTWDFPIYWGLAALCYAAGRYAAGRRLDMAYWLHVVLWAGRALILGVLLFLPFYIGFGSQASGIGLVLINKTRPWHYFVMFGLFLVAGAAFIAHATAAWVRGRRFAWAGDATIVAVVAGFFVALSAFTGRWTALGVAQLVAALVLSVTRRFAQGKDAGETALDDVTVSLMMIVGFLLTFAVEFVFLRDYFGTRMNTVFKFYYQAWVLLGLGGAYALWAVFGRGERAPGRWAAVGRGIFAALFSLTLAASLVYTFAAGYTKANGFRGDATLNCLAFVQKYNPAEYDAIAWLNANVKGAPVILEATGGSYSEFARISARTGLPTLLGWDFHEQQWRGNRNPAGNRAGEIEALYRTPDSAESLTRLRTYGITYIYVGDLERSKYTLGESVVNRWDNIAERVYDAGGVRIYRYSPMQ